MKFSFTAKNEPECKSFLKIRMPDGEYQPIDEFIKAQPAISEADLEACFIKYRGDEKTYKQDSDDYVAFSETMKFVNFIPPMLIVDQSIKPAIYFAQKAIECLQFARFFTMKSNLILDTDYNTHWAQGYVPQYLFRCIYFGTATTWYSNAFDHVLQTVYWGKKLYTSAVDRDGIQYSDTWDAKKIMTYCTYEFVVGELKKCGDTALRKCLTSCSGAIEQVRSWANYIKHKGGIDYKYLEPENPFKLYFMPMSGEAPNEAKIGVQYQEPDARYEIKDFKSPIEIDIDDKIEELVKAHTAIFECIENVLGDMNFEQYAIQIGGAT